MAKRYMVLWFPYLTTDWLTLRKPELKDQAFVFALPEHGRMMIAAVNIEAQKLGLEAGMRLADAKAMVPGLQVVDYQPGKAIRLLKGIGEWCIRYSPIVAVYEPDCLILDISGCTHLWGNEQTYYKEIASRLNAKGYYLRTAIADTIGAAWANCHYGKLNPIVQAGKQKEALLCLPPAALRLEPGTLQRLHKLGFYQIDALISIPRSNLRRRFGEGLLLRLAQALGQAEEYLQPLQLPEPFQERLPSLDPIRTRAGIEMAIQKLLDALCLRLAAEGKGLRAAILKSYRIDGKIEQVGVNTYKASNHAGHLFKLFELEVGKIEPALGIELFVLEAPKTEDVEPTQEAFWKVSQHVNDALIAQVIDRVAGRVGAHCIHRYLPEAHYWPERSVKLALSLSEKPVNPWQAALPRPTQLLARPECIEVSAPIPDYPPMLFRYQGRVHHIKKADGPERIEREWWLDEGEHRDYYIVEDDKGQRYWLFRSGHYDAGQSKWFIHGFFA